MNRFLFVILSFLVTFMVLFGSVASCHGQSTLVKLKLKNEQLVGSPVFFQPGQVKLMGRDGQLWDFDPKDAADYESLGVPFQPFSAGEMRSALAREFPDSDIRGTGHYLVVQVGGANPEWPDRFEQLYRSMVHYFQARGIAVNEPTFPMVAVVMPNQSAFLNYTSSMGDPVSPSVLGYYDPDTNRILMYDQAAFGPEWEQTAATLVHEAAHQTAFNTGIHSRVAMPPRWIAEGLGQLFEAPGVYDSRKHGRFQDRILTDSARQFGRQFPNGINEQILAAMVASDELFRRFSGAAYPLAWAMTFMIAEQEPQKLAQYLKVTANAKPTDADSPQHRVADFMSVFGNDLKMIASRLNRFMDEL